LELESDVGSDYWTFARAQALDLREAIAAGGYVSLDHPTETLVGNLHQLIEDS
jgi:hypothetical protein